ncbi:MAG: type II secretion system F family protein [Actinomycetes bacterium]
MANPSVLIVGVLLVSVAGALALIGSGLPRAIAHHWQVGRSLAAIRGLRPSGDSAAADHPGGGGSSAATDAVAERLRQVGAAGLLHVGQRLTPTKRQSHLNRLLDRAGHPYGLTVERLVLLKGLGATMGTVIALLLLAVAGFSGPPLLAACSVLLAGFYAPDLFVHHTAHDRSQRITAELADSLDLLTVSVEAGLAFDAALQQVSRNTDGPLAQEFARVLREMHLGTGRSAALLALADRTDVDDLQRFAATVVQADRLGVPIARVLRVQAAEMRTKRSQRAEEAAHKVPVKILFPLILCIMPALFIVILGPAAIQIVTTFPAN